MVGGKVRLSLILLVLPIFGTVPPVEVVLPFDFGLQVRLFKVLDVEDEAEESLLRAQSEPGCLTSPNFECFRAASRLAFLSSREADLYCNE